MSGKILQFGFTDGLTPIIMRKLNSNFSILQDMIKDPQIVSVAGATAPDPRTDETLWYDTETGDLYIWAQGVDTTTGLPDGNWSWKKLDLNIVRFGAGQPEAYVSDGQMLYYDYEHHLLYVYTGMGYWEAGSPDDIYHETTAPQWWTLEGFIEEVVYNSFLDPDGELYDEFANAVMDIMGV